MHISTHCSCYNENWPSHFSTRACSTDIHFPLIPKVNSADDVCKLWTLTPRDKEILRKKGIKWQEGPWRQNEVEILDENIKNYCLERGYEDPSKGRTDKIVSQTCNCH